MNLSSYLKAFLFIAVTVLALAACFPGRAIEGHSQIGYIPSLSAEQSYKVYKIKSLNNLFLIYARRNDSIFEIVSRKEKIVSRKEKLVCKNIKVGKTYQLRTTVPLWR